MLWEFHILNALQNMHNSVLNFIIITFSTLGEAGIIWILFSVILILNKKYRICGILALITLGFNYVIGDLIIKNIVQRERPCIVKPIYDMIVNIPSSYSFPSGHTSSSFAVATSIFFWNKKMGKIAYVIASIIAFSRMYLYVHFPTDIIGGIILGVIDGFVVYFVYKMFFETKMKIYLR